MSYAQSRVALPWVDTLRESQQSCRCEHHRLHLHVPGGAARQSLTLLAPETAFVQDSFSADQGGVVFGDLFPFSEKLSSDVCFHSFWQELAFGLTKTVTRARKERQSTRKRYPRRR